MSKPKREQCTNSQASEKSRPETSFPQIESELTEAQLETIAGGKLTGN